MNRVTEPSVPPNNQLQINHHQIDHLQIDHLELLVKSRSIIACTCFPKLPRLQPRSSSLRSLDYGLQVYTQTCLMMASRCISKVAHSRHLSVSQSSLDLSFQEYLQTRSITAPVFISEVTRQSSSGAPVIALEHCPQPVLI